MDNEQLIQQFIQQFTGPKRVEVEQFLRALVTNQRSFAEAAAAANREFKSTSITVTDVANSISGVLDSLGRSNDAVKETRKSFNKLQSITRKIQDDQVGIYDLSLKELKTSRTQAKSELARLRFINKQLRLEAEQAGGIENLSSRKQEVLRLGEQDFENQVAILGLIEERIGKQKRLDSSLGLTGAILDNLNNIGVRALGGIGVNVGILTEAFEDAKDSSKSAARDIAFIEEQTGETFSELSKRIITLKAAIPGLKTGIQEGFNDPLSLGIGILTKITKQVGVVNAAQTKLVRQTGSQGLALVPQAAVSRASTLVDLLETAATITNQVGLNAEAIFTPNQIKNISDSATLLGITVEESSKLATFGKLTAQSQSNFTDSLFKGADAANKLFKSAVPPGIALKEAANTSADIVLSLGMAPGRLGQAATAAKALGLELSKVDSIADQLLDFESSIQNELEAQLLTGRSINLNRAREFALTNDLAGLTEEIGNNIVSAAEFAEMNRIQQVGLAKALGLSRQELGEIVLQTSIAGTLSEKQRASVLGIEESQLKQLDIQESIQKSFDKIFQSLAGPLASIASILEKAGVIQTIIGVGIVGSIAKFTFGLIMAFKNWQLVNGQLASYNKKLATTAVLNSTIANQGPKNIGGAGTQMEMFGPTGGKNIGKKATKALSRKPILTGAARLGGGLARFLPGIGALIGLVSLAPLVKDLVFGDDVISKPGYGGRVMLDKGGITSFNNKDYITASTNPPGSGNKRVEQLLERLIANTEKTGAVYIDGREVGTAMVMNSYKSS
jgi:hypothetical protein